MGRKLYRSRTERLITGVCGGIAEYYAVDPTLIRVLALLAGVVSFGTAIIVYLIMSIVVPESPLESDSPEVVPMSEAPGGAQGSPAGPVPPPVPVQSDVLAEPAVPVPPAPPGPAPVAPAPPAPTPPAAPPPAAPAVSGAPPVEAHPRRGGIVFGVVLVFLGLGLLASQFVPGLELWRLWPLVLVAIGLSIMFRGGSR